MLTSKTTGHRLASRVLVPSGVQAACLEHGATIFGSKPSPHQTSQSNVPEQCQNCQLGCHQIVKSAGSSVRQNHALQEERVKHSADFVERFNAHPVHLQQLSFVLHAGCACVPAKSCLLLPSWPMPRVALSGGTLPRQELLQQ